MILSTRSLRGRFDTGTLVIIYLRLSVVSSAEGTRPVMVDLARGLTHGRILYATLARSAGPVRIETFRSASDRHPMVSDLSIETPTARHLLALGERALRLRCEGKA